MQRFAIREGWTTFILISVVVFTATWSVQLADWADGLQILTVVTALGLLTGLALSKMRRLPAFAAHLISLAVGAVVVLYQVTEFLSDGLGSRGDKLDYLWTRWSQWFDAISAGDRADDLYLFVLLMAGLLWVLSYICVWFVFRSHWIWLALLLPAVILLLNLGYSLKVPNSLVVLYLIAAILLLMRFNYSRRESLWRRSGIPFPNTLIWRGFWVASYLALFVVVFGWVVPLSTQNQAALSAWRQVNGPWVSVESHFNEWFGSLRGPGSGPGVGGFASFSDSFDLGGPLTLSDTPVVVVRGTDSPYLAAHRYNVFTGKGWESDVEETFAPLRSEGYRGSPLISLEAGEEFPVPQVSSQEGKEASYGIEILRPRGALVYSPGQLQSATVPTQVLLSWYTYDDQTLDVQSATEESTPPALWPLVELLKIVDFTPPQPIPTPEATPEPTPGASATPDATATPEPAPTPTPEPTLEATPRGTVLGDPPQLPQIERLQDELRAQGVTTEYQLSEIYNVDSLTFSGPLPVFADVEAVFAQNGVRSNDQYQITALVNDATEDELRTAPNVYPDEITSRYLDVPQVTDRTRQLAAELAAGQATTFDIANNIEQYLRNNLVYREDVDAPPEDSNFVDYFLFESKEGYCTYYATSMATLLRIEGIPSRVAVGFYPAQYDDEYQGYLYRDLNAHAWVEVYFPGFGWIPFEPTAARSPIVRTLPEAPVQPGDTTGTNSDIGVSVFEDDLLGFDDLDIGAGGLGAPVQRNDETSPASWAFRGGILMLAVFLIAAAYFWLRGLRGLSPTTQFYTKVQRAATWGGVPVRASMTPYEYASSVSQEIPGARPHVRLLADLYVRERYSAQEIDQNELTRARSAWLRLRGLLLRYALLQRWRPRRNQRTNVDDW